MQEQMTLRRTSKVNKRNGDVSIYLGDVSNASHSDAQQVLKDIRKSNVNKLVFGQLNINSLRSKFDMVSEN